MKKLFIVSSILFLLPALSYTQSLVTKKIFSTYVNDSITVQIWLPKDYSQSERYPVIYEFIYNHTNYIAATASNMWDIPKLIVVHAQIEGGNGDYRSPNLTEEGQKYYAFVKNELLPYISKEYNTIDFRIAAGLSQGADYINYILRNDPSLFKSYLLFSTEYPVNYQPVFSSYTVKIKDSTSYYIAIANDTKDRIAFANQLFDSLKTSPYLRIKKNHFTSASHSYSILYALPEALLFAFEDYNIPRQRLASESLISYYIARLKEKKEKFGNFNYHSVINEIGQAIDVQRDSVKEINTLLDIVYSSKESIDIDLLNLGYILRTKKLYKNAEKAYQMALLKNQETGIINLTTLSLYIQLYRVYDAQGQINEALKTLEEGYEKTKSTNESLLYPIGFYYIDKKIDLKKGIKILQSILNEKHTFFGFLSQSKDEVLSKIATGYWELKNKKQAKIFLDEALEINPQNENALKLKAVIK
jgi:tetratricopeptide (TPR) repeat protein